MALLASTYGGTIWPPTYDDQELQRATSRVSEEGCRIAVEAGLSAKPESAQVTYEGTWHTILSVADRHDVGLIVLGARGLSTFKAIVLGSVSYGVAQHAHRPVLIVPEAPQVEGVAPVEHAVSTA